MNVVLLGAVLMHPLYTITDTDPKTCYALFPDTKGGSAATLPSRITSTVTA
jgi:hypothetical protein